MSLLPTSPIRNLPSPKGKDGEWIATTTRTGKAKLLVVEEIDGEDHEEKALPNYPIKSGTDPKVTPTKKGRRSHHCNGFHWSQDCPKRNKLTALLTMEGEEQATQVKREKCGSKPQRFLAT